MDSWIFASISRIVAVFEVPSFLWLACHHSEKFSIHHLCKDQLVIGRWIARQRSEECRTDFPRGQLYISYIGSTDLDIWHFICMDLYRTSIVSWSIETKYAVYKLKKFQMWQVPEFWQNVTYCLLYILYCHQEGSGGGWGSVSQLWEIGGKIGEIFQPVPSPSPR